MLRSCPVIVLLLTTGIALPAGARPSRALGPDGRVGRRELFRAHWERAAAAFQRAVDSGHPTPAELEGLGYACLKSKRYGDAASAYQRLCTAYPDQAPFWLNLGLAEVYQVPARLEEAEKGFQH